MSKVDKYIEKLSRGDKQFSKAFKEEKQKLDKEVLNMEEVREFVSYEFEGDGRPIINLEFKNGTLVSKDIGDSGHNYGMTSEFTFYARGFEAGVESSGMGDLISVVRNSYYISCTEEGHKAKRFLAPLGLWDADMEEWLTDTAEYEEEYDND